MHWLRCPHAPPFPAWPRSFAPPFAGAWPGAPASSSAAAVWTGAAACVGATPPGWTEPWVPLPLVDGPIGFQALLRKLWGQSGSAALANLLPLTMLLWKMRCLLWPPQSADEAEQEHFNHLHSSIRNVVERNFGVWKMKRRILLKMPNYPMAKQMMIVAATMCLHDYIRENHALDKDFHKCDRIPDYVPTIPSRYGRHQPLQNASDTSTPYSNDRVMDKFRDDIARAIFLSRS